MKALRRLHSYLGLFFAPLLIFFVATGWYQTVTIQRNKSSGQPGDWISNLSQVHVDQIYPTERGAEHGYSPTLFRWTVVAMSISLLLTIALGIFLAFRSNRRRWPVWLSLALGILLPALFLWLGPKR
jgi:ABC-type sugar transport system permease subunit